MLEIWVNHRQVLAPEWLIQKIRKSVVKCGICLLDFEWGAARFGVVESIDRTMHVDDIHCRGTGARSATIVMMIAS